MAKLGETIVSSAISGKPLTLSDKAFESVANQSNEVAELKGQVAALVALISAQQVKPVEVEPVVEKDLEVKSPSKPKAEPTKAVPTGE